MTHLYRPLLRPASVFTLPKSVVWEYVEAPPSLTTRPDLKRSEHRFGVIKTDRALTKTEQINFDLLEV